LVGLETEVMSLVRNLTLPLSVVTLYV